MATRFLADPALATIDSLLWTQPDSAFVQLQGFAGSHEVDSLDPFNRHYFHLLFSELLYKNDYAQTNRDELLRAVDYYDSLVAATGTRVPDNFVFLDARAHYIDGVGYYEMDSVIPACREYLRAVELMEEHFGEEELMGKKAQFMALAYTHLAMLFSDQYLHEQSIYFGRTALSYYKYYNAQPWHVSWVLEGIGASYDMMDQLDSATYYYDEAISILDDTSSLIFRDILAHQTFLSFRKGDSLQVVADKFQKLLQLSGSELESTSRCLSLGELFYCANQLDSCRRYMHEVFYSNCDQESKLFAAKRLLDVDSVQQANNTNEEYFMYLSRNVKLVDQSGATASMLSYLHHAFQENKMAEEHRKRIGRIRLSTISGAALMLCLLSALLVAYNKSSKRKKDLEIQIEEERGSFKLKQEALSGRLRRSNAELRSKKEADREKEEKKGYERDEDVKPEEKATLYLEEPICRHILNICNNGDVAIKATVPKKHYRELGLTSVQLAQLNDAANRHYGQLFELLSKKYPELKWKDNVYCQLCLLGLNNVQIAIMLQKSPSTISSQKKRLQRIFNQNCEISIILNGFIIS